MDGDQKTVKNASFAGTDARELHPLKLAHIKPISHPLPGLPATGSVFSATYLSDIYINTLILNNFLFVL
jgi:hypothetical protein